MAITYDSRKRFRTLAVRGLDFEDAALVFEGRLVVVGYTTRGEDRHVFSMRKANGREKKRLAAHFKI